MPDSSPFQPLRSPSTISPSSSSSSLADLNGSFVIVPTSDDEAETESTSTIGTALLDEISDTSSEPRHAGSLGGSYHGSLSDAEDDLDFVRDREVDPTSSYGGSYADAEATASLLTDPRTTLSADMGSPNIPEFTPIPRPTMKGAGSEFRFIFPNPEASFSSSGTYTGGATPSGSLTQLPPVTALGPASIIGGIGNDAPFARLSVEARQKREKSPARGVDEGWLKDARTWAPAHSEEVTMLMPSWEKGRYEAPAVPQVAALEKTVEVPATALGEGMELDRKEDKLLLFPVEEGQLQLKRALRAMVAAGAGTSGNRWGLLAFASCALAILGAFGPGISYLSKADKTAPAYNVSSASSTPPLRASISLEEVFASVETPSATASHAHTPRSIATQLIPDLLSIRDALSTFTSGPKAEEGKAEPQHVSTACCSSAAEHSTVALTLPTKGDLAVFDDKGYKAWMKAMSNIVRTTGPIIPPAPVEMPTPCNCTASTSIHVENRYAYLIQRTRDYAVFTTSAIAQLYHPMMLHLDHELRELSRLAAYIAERPMTQSAIRHLHAAGLGARGLGLKLAKQRVVQVERIHRLAAYASSAWGEMTKNVQKRRMAEQEALQTVLKVAQEGLGKLGEKADGVKHEGERSLKKAKKGLDRLIETNQWAKAEAGNVRVAEERQALRTSEGSETAKSDENMRPRDPRHRFTRSGRRMLRERRSRERRRVERATRAGMQGDAIVVAENGRRETTRKAPGGEGGGQTKWRRLLEAVHHGAIQIVLQ